MPAHFVSLSGERHALQACSVAEAKAEIAAFEQVAADALSFSLNGAPFEALEAGDIVVAEEVDGGAKGKKKKKVYTTPKHVAHKHKKVKLAVLKYYSVDNGKIQNLRVNCVGNCPVGIKMAAHKDRSHCGRCGVTIFKESA